MDSVTRLFTFGYEHQCPYTGKDLGDHYALITAPDASSARTFMNTAFKRNWGFEYDGAADPKIAPYMDRMTLHLTVNLVPRQPDAEITQPIAGRVPPHVGAVVNEGGHTAVSIGGGLIEIDPPWSPGTGFFEPGRVPELVGDDLPSAPKSRCDCIAYQGDHNCAAIDGCRCSEVFPTSAPCTCGHDFEDHESDEHGTGGRCQARIDDQPYCPRCTGLHDPAEHDLECGDC